MIRYFAGHPTAANLLMLLFVVLGLLSLPSIQRETFPDFAAEDIEVQVVYPGASPAEIEEAICRRIEDATDGVNDIDEMRCEAREGIGKAVLTMADGGQIDRFIADVSTEIEAIDTFPERAEAPIVRQLGWSDPVVSIAAAGPMDPPSLKAFAERLKARLLALPEVSLVDIHGFSDHQLRVHVSATKLRQYGLSVGELANVITRQSVKVPVGSIDTREGDIVLRFDDERRDVQALEDLIVVAGESGASIRLGEIATISDRFDREEEQVIVDGQRAALLKVSKTKREDVLDVFAAVENFVEQERLRVAPGVTLSLTEDLASIVKDRLQMLFRNGWQGLALVFLVMVLFFPLRFAFWVAGGLPVSFLAGFWLMGGIGYSVNMITMVALLIALGLLMDDAIVISENIAAHLRRGKKALQAAIDGTREVAPGVLSSFLTSCAIFGPLAFISGDIGRVLKVLPVVLILVLAVSLVEAFMILPNHLAHSLQGHDGEAASRKPGRVDRFVEWCKDNVVGRAVDFAVHWRYGFVGSVIALFLVSVAMVASGRLGFLAFPDIDGDVVEARVLLPQGAPLDRTKAVVDELVAALGRTDEKLSARESDGDKLVQSVTVRYAKNADAAAPGPHVATVTVNLLTAQKRASRIDEILELWRQETGTTPDVLNLSFTDPTIGPAGRAIDIRLQGENLMHLESASQELVQWLSRYRGAKHVMSDLRPGKPERQIRLREGALALGLDAQTVAAQLRATFFGTTAYEVQVGTESLAIDVRASPQDTDSLEDLENFRLVAADGSLVPLLSVADIRTQRGFSRIQRIDRVRTVTVQGDVDVRAANAISIVNDTQSRFMPGLLERYPGVTVSLEGEAAEAGQTGSSVRNGFALGLVGVFLILSFQFRSYIEPLVVMSIIPLAFIGVVWGHLFMGLDLSMPSIMGFVSLSGIVVNDSILLISFLKRRREQGQATVAAAKLASRDRFRAVMLTSLTTIAGLLPLLSERSLQAQVLTPLVTSIAFGLMATTLLVLFVVPALYAILDDFGLSEPAASTAHV